MFILAIIAQAIFGWKQHNENLLDLDASGIGFMAYLSGGYCLEATFENFQSEFLQMAMYVILTVFLRQVGSAESKDSDKPEVFDREPDPNGTGSPGLVK